MADSDLLTAATRLLASGDWRQAEVAARQAIAEDPDDLKALLLAGLAVAAMGEAARAASVLCHVAALQPDGAHPCAAFSDLQPALPRPLVARQYRACLRLVPNDRRLRLEFAAFMLDSGDPAEAVALLADGSDSAAGHHLMGLAKADLGRFADAADSFKRAVTLDPAAGASWSNLGMVLKVEGWFAKAHAAHNRALALDPDNKAFRLNRAIALLKAGAWQPAWPDYEARLGELRGIMPSLSPGDELHGKTVLALQEEGYGDTLQFLRYLPLLAQRGARVVACVPPALKRILRLVPGIDLVITDVRQAPPHDFVCPMFSLPRVFGTTIRTIPKVPRIVQDPALLRRWAGRLPHGSFRVGLVWAGQARPQLPGFGTLDRRRSAGLNAFEPLFAVPGVTFVSLQAGPAARQARPAGLVMHDPMPEVTDFADTAAIVAALDLVVSVDTSVVHLAGLIGKPVFLLDRYDGCWRWLAGRADSPWYPAMTIFRQHRPEDWSGAMAAAAASLEAMSMYRGASFSLGSLRERAFVA